MTEDDPLMLTNKKFNYLVMSSGKPSLFVYNNYKTYSKYKQRVIPVADDIVPYLLKYIKSAKLMPIVGQLGNYLFGSNENTEQNGNFGTKEKRCVLYYVWRRNYK